MNVKRSRYRHLSKILSLTLCIAMLLSLMAPVAYADDIEGLNGSEQTEIADEQLPETDDVDKTDEVENLETQDADEKSGTDGSSVMRRLERGISLKSGLEAETAAYDVTWYSIEESAFTITSGAQLAGLAAIVNGQAEGIATDSFSGKNVTLGDDIDLAAYLGGKSWTPIGTQTTPFKGTFDGSGKTVSGLTIGTEDEPVRTQYQGLFGYIDSAEIKDLSLHGSIYTSSHYAAGLAGGAKNVVISGVTNNVTLVGSTYNNNSAQNVAGLIGYSTGTLDMNNCTNNGDIKTKGSNAAGLVGNAGGSSVTIKNCMNNGDISAENGSAAGIVTAFGRSTTGTIEKCGDTGNVSTKSASVGGIIASCSRNCTITNCYALGEVKSESGSNVGGIIGNPQQASVKVSSSFYYNETAPCRASGTAGGTLSNVLILKADKYAGNGGGIALSKESFKSGEAAYLLNGGEAHGTVWTNGETYPVFGDASTEVIYQVSVKAKKVGTAASAEVVPPEGYSVSGEASSGYKLYVPAGKEVKVLLTGSDAIKLETTPEGALSGSGSTYTAVVNSDIDVLYYIESEKDLPEVYWYSPTATDFTLQNEQQLRGFEMLVNGKTGFGAVNFSGQTVMLGADITLTSPWTPIGSEEMSFAGTFNGGSHTISNLQIGTEAAPVSYSYMGFFAYNEGTINNLTVKGSIYSTGEYIGGIVAYNKGTLDNLTFGDETAVGSSKLSGAKYVGGIAGYSASQIGSSKGTILNYAAVTASGDYAGGIAGYTEKSIQKAKNYGEINGASRVGGIAGGSDSSLSNSENYGKITASGDYAGGITGESKSSTSSCSNEAQISAAGKYVGGIVGYGASVSSGKNTGAISGASYVGGMAGYSTSYVNSSNNTGAVTSEGDYVGGIAGYTQNGVSSDENTGTVKGASYVGGIVGYTETSSSNCVSNAEQVLASGDYVGGIAGYIKTYVTGKSGSIMFNGKVAGHDMVGGIAGYIGGYIRTVTVGEKAEVLAADLSDMSKLTGLAAGIAAKADGDELSASFCLAKVSGEKTGLLAGEVAKDCKVSNSFYYNAAQDNGSLFVKNEGKAENTYYLAKAESEDGGKTAAQFASGEVAWLLDGGEETFSKTYFTQKDGALYPTHGAKPIFRVRLVTKDVDEKNKVTLKDGTFAAAFTEEKTENDLKTKSQWAYVRSGEILKFEILEDAGYEINFIPAMDYTAVTPGEGEEAPAVPQYTTTVKANYDGEYNVTQVVPPSYEWYKNEATDEATGKKIYNIATESDLLGLSNLVSGKDMENSGASAPVSFAGEVINLTDNIGMKIGNWRPIGLDGTPFEGTFNGGGHKITGLKLSSLSDKVGLFGFVKGATIKDLQLKAEIASSGSAIGGVIGEASGSLTMENVVLLKDSKIQGIKNVGGLVGRVEMTVADEAVKFTGCKNYGNVSTTDKQNGNAGGLAGAVAGKSRVAVSFEMQDCRNLGSVNATGRVAGGLVGISGESSSAYITGTFKNCVNEGRVSAAQNAGGIFGNLNASGKAYQNSVIECVNEGTVSTSGDNCGGLAGNVASYVSFEKCNNKGTVKGDGANVGGLAGNIGSYNNMTACINAGKVSGEKNYVGGIAGKINSKSEVTGCYSEEDAVVNGSAQYTGGLFGRTYEINISESYNLGAVNGGSTYTGGIAGCFEGSTIAKYVHNSGKVDGQARVGGITGKNGYGTIKRSYNEGRITAGGSDIGGIAGYVDASGYKITACYNTGEVSSTGTAANVGGITGSNHYSGGGSYGIISEPTYADGGVNGCFNKGNITARRGNAGQITGAYYELNKNCYALEEGVDSSYCTAITEEIMASPEGAWLVDGGETDERLLAWTDGEKHPEFVSAEEGPVYKVALHVSGEGSLGGSDKDSGMYKSAGEAVKVEIAPASGQKLFRFVTSLGEDKYTINTARTSMEFEMPNSDVSITAVFVGEDVNEDSKIVAFDANGGSFADGSQVKTEIVDKGSKVSSPATPSREKYCFDDWFKDSEASDKADFPIAINEDMTFYAGWTYEGEGFASGTGTEEDPYLITSSDDMYLLAQAAGSAEYKDKYYKVTADELTLDKKWQGIGSSSKPFTGTFDGNGAVIRLTAGRGLFNATGASGSNVYIKNFTLQAVLSTGASITGGVVSFHSSGDLYLENVTVSGSVLGGQATGGFIGATNGNRYSSDSDGTHGTDTVYIKDCVNNADVSGSGVYVGGFAGNMYATFRIENCKNTGDIEGLAAVGGILGWYNTGIIKNSGNTGNIEATKDCAGGVLGGPTEYVFQTGNERYIESCYNSGSVKAANNVAGIVGYGIGTNENYKIVNCFNSGVITVTKGDSGAIDSEGANTSDCYALDTTITSKDKGVSGLTEDQIKAGRAAYLLDVTAEGRRNLWTQNKEEGHPEIGAPQYYPATVSAVNGKLKIDGRSSDIYLGAGDTIKVTAIPDKYTENKQYGPQYGYVLTSLKVNGVPSSDLTSFVMPADEADIVAVFELQQTGNNKRPEDEKHDSGTGDGAGDGTGNGGMGDGTGDGTGNGDGEGVSENTGTGTNNEAGDQSNQDSPIQAVTADSKTEQAPPKEIVITEPIEEEQEEDQTQNDAPEITQPQQEEENLLDEEPDVAQAEQHSMLPVIGLLAIIAAAAAFLIILLKRKNRGEQ